MRNEGTVRLMGKQFGSVESRSCLKSGCVCDMEAALQGFRSGWLSKRILAMFSVVVFIILVVLLTPTFEELGLPLASIFNLSQWAPPLFPHPPDLFSSLL